MIFVLFEATDLIMVVSSWVLPKDISTNLWFRQTGVLFFLWAELKKSCSAPDILGFKFLSLQKDCLFSLYVEIGASSGSGNLNFFE